MNQYKIIAMIPARLGSKRIPKKNIRYLLDKPLIQYPIDLCLQSDLFEEVWVNTENLALGKLTEKMGASFHKRPEMLATDIATNREFVYEFLQNHTCDYIIMVNTTSPLLTANTLKNFVTYVQQHDFDTILSTISEKEETFFKQKPLNFTFGEKINSQFLEPVEKVVWSMTAWKRKTFLKLQDKGINPIFGGNLGYFSIPKDEACDLDTEEDWKIAEGILTARKNNIIEKRYIEL